MNAQLLASIAIIGGLANVCAVLFAVYRVGGAVSKFELIGQQQAQEIAEVKQELKTLNEIMIKVALQGQRLDSHSKRLGLIEQAVVELRHGNGFIVSKRHETSG